MKILVVNPNITESVTRLIGDEARRAAAPGTELTLCTAPFGVAYIETRFEAMIGAYATAQVVGERVEGHDAVIVAAFGDPGVPALREALEIPVVGLTEAALACASLLGGRFAIISISRRIAHWYRESVAACGMLERLAGIRALDRPIRDIGAVQEEHARRLREMCQAAIDEDGADVIILGGAPLAGLARAISADIQVPVVDGVAAAVRQAEAMVRLGAAAPRAGSYAAPPVKPHAGLPDAIARLLDRQAPGKQG